MPLFSVVIPTYNRAKDLKRCLGYLTRQTYKDFEVLVCDDGSEDNSREVTDSFCDRLAIRFLSAGHSGTPARPRNLGWREAIAPWICFLDSDDWWYPNKLMECAKYLEEADIIYHDLAIYHDQEIDTGRVLHSRQVGQDVLLDLLINHNALANSSVVLRKSILEEIGGLSEEESLAGVEDFDCWLRVAQKTNRFKYIPEVLGGYYLGQNISRTLRHVEHENNVFQKYLGLLPVAQQKKALATLRYSQARVYHLNGCYQKARKAYFSSFTHFRWKAFLGWVLSLVRIKF